MFQKKSGSDVIVEALGGFEKAAVELEKGIELCDEECKSINAEKQELDDREKTVLASRARAVNAVDKIRRMIS